MKVTYEITSLHNAKLLGSVRVFFVYRQLFQDDHIVGVMLFNFCQMLRIENILCGKKVNVKEIADFLHDFCILQSMNLYPIDGIRPDERGKLFDGSSLTYSRISVLYVQKCR